MHEGVKHNESKFSVVSKFSLDTICINGDNPLFCKTSVGRNIAFGFFNFEYLGAPKHICTSVPHKTALAGKACYSLAGTVERSL